MSLPESFFVSATIHPRTVKLQDDTEHVLHFKELPAVEFRRWRDAERSESVDVREAGFARLVSLGVCNPDGSQAMTAERALLLKGKAASALLEAILEVNAPGAKGNA